MGRDAMRLLKFKISGIKRFEVETSLTVGDQLVAIVGPNEAGKSTLLDALDMMDSPDPLPESIRTRRIEPVPRIKALFELEEADKAAIAGVHEAENIERCWLEKSSRRSRSWTLEEEPRRDLGPRREALRLLQQCRDDPHLSAEFSDPEGTAWDQEQYDDGLDILASEDDTMEEQNREVLSELRDRLLAIQAPAPDPDDEGNTDPAENEALAAAAALRGEAAQALKQTILHEASTHPRDQVIAILEGRIPRFAKFEESDRNLRDDYDLNEVAGDPPNPLDNLARLAGLDLVKLQRATEERDKGHVELLCKNANERLAHVFADSWDQSIATPYVRVDDSVLAILIEAGSDIGWIPVGDRSEGLRWFLALRAFLHRDGVEDTILLIDEVETHLHLGAQANLIEVLTNQRLAKQVIYTTHSPGALPPDLGTGVRAVVPSGEHRSEVDNAFWTSGPGHAPLLFGMGAGALAFSIPRRLLLAEGASEAILLPTLIREATGGRDLPYRVAPGISNAPAENLRDLADEAGRVAYLVDGDAGGDSLKSDLIEAGVEPSLVHSLGALTGEAAALEDLITAESYIEAVHAELRPYLKDDVPKAADLGDVGRAPAVSAWCKAREVDPPSKVRVAQRVVASATKEPGKITPILNASGKAALATLHGLLADQLGFKVEPDDPADDPDAA